MARIGNRHKVRNQVASVPNYFDYKSEALNVIESYLNENGFRLNSNNLNCCGNDGTVIIPILVDKEFGVVCSSCDCEVELDNVLVFQWYRMPSGKWEITTYIS